MSKVDKVDNFLPNRKPGQKSALMTLATDDYEDFVSKETQNRRQDKKLIDDITSVLYRLEMDSVKPSFDVLERTGIHKRRSRGTKQADQSGASKGKQQQRRKQQVSDDTESDIVIDPNVIYTADGVLRSKWAPRDDTTSEYRTLLNQLTERQVERNRQRQPEEEPKDARGRAKKSAAAAAAASAAENTFSYTLPRSWRHQMAEEKFAALQDRSKEPASYNLSTKSSKADDRIIYVDDLPYANAGSSLQRYAELTELRRLERSRPLAAATERVGTAATGSYVRRSQKQPTGSSSYLLGDDELASYLYEPHAGDDLQVRREVLRPLQRSSMDDETSSYGVNDAGSDLGYLEQLLLGRPVDYSPQKQNGYKDAYSYTTTDSSDFYPREQRGSRLPYSPPTVVTSPVPRYGNW